MVVGDGESAPAPSREPETPDSRQFQPRREKIDADIEADEVELNPLPHRDKQTGEAE